MKIQTRSATALLFLSAALAACAGSAATAAPAGQGQASTPAPAGGGAQSAAPAASTPAAAGVSSGCALITEKEATALLGSDPGPGVEGTDATTPSCAYDGSLTFSLDASAGKAKFDADKAAAAGSDKMNDLPGVGDAGYAFIVGGAIAQVEVLKGSAILTVNIQGNPASGSITVAALTTLMTAAVGRF